MRRNAQKWIPFGFDTDSNKIVDIASVENGLSCNCICLICGTSLIARQGQNKKWHFSHSTEVKGFVVSSTTYKKIHKGENTGKKIPCSPSSSAG
jgi:hypothetical protein